MTIFSIFAVMGLFLIYFILRYQAANKQANAHSHTVSVMNKRLSSAYANIVLIANQLQNLFVTRLEENHKKGIIDSSDHNVISILVYNLSAIVVDCSEKGATLEEAIKKVTQQHGVDLGLITNFIKNQPSDVRMAWSRNRLDGFILVCDKITQGTIRTSSENS